MVQKTTRKVAKATNLKASAKTLAQSSQKTSVNNNHVGEIDERPSKTTKRKAPKEKEPKGVSENGPKTEGESENAKIADKKTLKSDTNEEEEVNTASEKPKDLKRRALPKGIDTVLKTKAKKQKVCFEVPTLKTVAGKVFVIGENDVGQLGLGEEVELKTRPSPLDLPQSIVDIAAGGMHSVCLTESGEVITFGCNDEGALGRVTTDESSMYIPRKVEISEKIIKVTAGDSHSAALSESGQVYVWGNFRCGDGPMGLTADGLKQTKPIKILNKVTVIEISSGNDHLVCLSSEGAVYTCGCAETGQLGRLSERTCQGGGRKGLVVLVKPDVVPLRVQNKDVTIDHVWTGSYSTFLRTHENGMIWAFGLNNYAQLGFQTVNNHHQFIPKKVSSSNNNQWDDVSGGQHHTLALNNRGEVYSIGRKDYGRLGLGEDCQDALVPTVIPTLQKHKCSQVSCGNCVSFAVTEQGSLFSWGFGTNHQLGHGDDEDCHVPTQIGGNFSKSWKALKVSGGGQHTLILAIPRESSKKTE